MSENILLAYSFDGKGNAKTLTGSDISKKIKDIELAWLHMDANHSNTKTWLNKELSYLDPSIISSLLEEETRPCMREIEDGVLIILRGVNLNENSAPEDMVSIRLWVDKHRIISVRKRKLKAISDIEDRLTKGKAPKNSGDFLCILVARLFERMEPVLTNLDEATDNIEEKILETANASLREEIVNIRKKAILFRRYMAPQKDAIAHLCAADISWLDNAHKRLLYESQNRITRYVEDLDAIRERSQIVKDELGNILSDRLNKNMYVLSVIAAIFLPLGFLTGLLGINVGGIPGVDNPNAFYIFSAILTFIIIVQVIIFKKFKWF